MLKTAGGHVGQQGESDTLARGPKELGGSSDFGVLCVENSGECGSFSI